MLVQPEIDKLNIRIDADGWGQYGGNAWFDDLKIEQLDISQNEIVSETNYYPPLARACLSADRAVSRAK